MIKKYPINRREFFTEVSTFTSERRIMASRNTYRPEPRQGRQGGCTTLEKSNVPDMTLFRIEKVSSGKVEEKQVYYMACRVLCQSDEHKNTEDLEIKNYRDSPTDFTDFTGLPIGVKVTISALSSIRNAINSGKLTPERCEGIVFGTLQVEDRKTTQYQGQLALATICYTVAELKKMEILKDGEKDIGKDALKKLFWIYGERCGVHWAQNVLQTRRLKMFEDMKKEYPE